MYGYGYGIDWTYLILVVPALILSLWAQAKVNSTFSRYSRFQTNGKLTGAEVARRILDSNGLQNVGIEHISGKLTDHYDPTKNVIRLSDSTYTNTSVAAAGVAAHESGHAVQYATKYTPILVRNAIVPAANIGSAVSMPLIILGIILGFGTLAYIGIALFSLTTVFQLVTLPVEFNASKRAVAVLESEHMLEDEELVGAKKVLTAAALTYVAALLTSLLMLLRFFLLTSSRSRR